MSAVLTTCLALMPWAWGCWVYDEGSAALDDDGGDAATGAEGGGGPSQPGADAADVTPPTAGLFRVGGTIEGLAGTTLVLTNRGADELTVEGDGAFEFPTRLAPGAAYQVELRAQPAGRHCQVSRGLGTIVDANVDDVGVACTPTFSLGGAAIGLPQGESVVLDNAGVELIVEGDGAFVFPSPLGQGAKYAVTIKTQPPSQSCTVLDGAGQITGADITGVSIRCCQNPEGGALANKNGTGTERRYCYAAEDSIEVRARKACEAEFGVGECCLITEGYQDQQYGRCGQGGEEGTRHFHFDDHPGGHCPPYYQVGDVVSKGWCGSVLGNFLHD